MKRHGCATTLTFAEVHPGSRPLPSSESRFLPQDTAQMRHGICAVDALRLEPAHRRIRIGVMLGSLSEKAGGSGSGPKPRPR
jgi:hypothetical protein